MVNNKLVIILVVGVFIVGGYFYVNSYQQKSKTIEGTEQVITEQTSGEEMITEGETIVEEEGMMDKALIALTSTGFEPSTLTIKAGKAVVWTNESGVLATINSSVHPTHLDYPPLNLGQFQDGESLSLVFDTPGTYRYHNHLNASQFGTIIVE